MIRRALRALIKPTWPDAGRRIVQGPTLERLMALAEVPVDANVLNAGAGEGLYSHLLASLPRVKLQVEVDVGYDSNPRKPPTFVRLVAGSLTDLPIASGTINVILCSEVLEHILNDDRAIDELRRVMAPGAWLLASTPTPPAEFDPAHVREGYTADELSRKLIDRGMEVIEVDYCMYFFFRLLLRWSRRVRWFPRLVVYTLASFDTWLRVGLPMDVVILARRAS